MTHSGDKGAFPGPFAGDRGLTKLEYGALLIAASMSASLGASGLPLSTDAVQGVARDAARIARAVLRAANE